MSQVTSSVIGIKMVATGANEAKILRRPLTAATYSVYIDTSLYDACGTLFTLSLPMSLTCR